MAKPLKQLQEKQLQLLIVLASGSLTSMTGGVVAPAMPTVIEQLQLEPALAGSLVSAHCLTIALFSLPLGVVADRIGAVRVLVPCLLLFALFGAAGALMQDFWSLLATRLLMGAACGGIAASCLGLLGRMYEGEARDRAIAQATATLTLAGILFPLLGGLAASWRWQYAFYLYTVGVPLALLAAWGFPFDRQLPRQRVATLKVQLSEVFHDQTLWRVLICIALVSVVMYAVVIYAPLYLQTTLAVSEFLNGVILASRAVGAAVISAFGAKAIAKAISVQGAIALGLLLMSLTLASIPFLQAFIWIWGAALLFGVGFGLALPNLYAALARLSPRELRASVLAAGIGAGFLGQFFSPVLLGPILGISGLAWVFYTAAGLAVGGIFLLHGKTFSSKIR